MLTNKAGVSQRSLFCEDALFDDSLLTHSAIALPSGP